MQLKLTISTVCLEKCNFLATKPNIGNIYKIEPCEEMSWYLPLSSLVGDRWERNDCSKPQSVPPPCSVHFSSESLFTTIGIVFTITWAVEPWVLRVREGPLLAKLMAMGHVKPYSHARPFTINDTTWRPTSLGSAILGPSESPPALRVTGGATRDPPCCGRMWTRWRKR